MNLDFFVMFSSIASILGNMGQSSYSACNAFQDSLAQYRRQVLGLPGLAINWGPISGAGVMERKSAVAKLLTIAGLGFIHAKDGEQFLHRCTSNAKFLNESSGDIISLHPARTVFFLRLRPVTLTLRKWLLVTRRSHKEKFQYSLCKPFIILS